MVVAGVPAAPGRQPPAPRRRRRLRPGARRPAATGRTRCAPRAGAPAASRAGRAAGTGPAAARMPTAPHRTCRRRTAAGRRAPVHTGRGREPVRAARPAPGARWPASRPMRPPRQRPPTASARPRPPPSPPCRSPRRGSVAPRRPPPRRPPRGVAAWRRGARATTTSHSPRRSGRSAPAGRPCRYIVPRRDRTSCRALIGPFGTPRPVRGPLAIAGHGVDARHGDQPRRVRRCPLQAPPPERSPGREEDPARL